MTSHASALPYARTHTKYAYTLTINRVLHTDSPTTGAITQKQETKNFQISIPKSWRKFCRSISIWQSVSRLSLTFLTKCCSHFPTRFPSGTFNVDVYSVATVLTSLPHPTLADPCKRNFKHVRLGTSHNEESVQFGIRNGFMTCFPIRYTNTSCAITGYPERSLL